MKIFGEMYTLSLIFNYVAVCRFCVVRCVIIIFFPLLFSNYWIHVFYILFYVYVLVLYIVL